MSRIAGGLYKALVLRHLHLARVLAGTAKFHGVEMPIIDVLPSYEETQRQYESLVHEWLDELPGDARDAGALVEFAIATLADQPIMIALGQSSVIGEDLDRHYAVEALGRVGIWLDQIGIKEMAADCRASQ